MAGSARIVPIAGVRFDALDEPSVVGVILRALDEGRGGWLVNPNVDVLVKISRDPGLKRLVDSANLVIADGAPVEWAARLAGAKFPPRVPGATFLWTLSRAAAEASRSVFLLGGNPGVAERASAVLSSEIPRLRIAGHHCPPFGFERSPDDLRAISKALWNSAPDIAFVGLGFPKQERLMSQLHQEFPQTWFVGSGASLTFAAGDIPRAPQWMSRIGIEWLHRLAREPRRLGRRYLVDDLPFAVKLLGGSLAQRWRRKTERVR